MNLEHTFSDERRQAGYERVHCKKKRKPVVAEMKPRQAANKGTALLAGASIMTTDSKRADQLLDLALRHARTIRVVIGELTKLNAERELRISGGS